MIMFDGSRLKPVPIPSGAETCGLNCASRSVSGQNSFLRTPPRTAFVVKHGPSSTAFGSVLGIPITWRAITEYELLSPARARLALEPLIPQRRDAGDESFGAFFRRRVWGETVDLVAEPLLGGIHAGDVEALSMTSLFPRFVEAEASGGSVLRSLRNTRPPSAGDGLFRSLAGGMGELVTALERCMPDGSIRCNAPVAAIVRDGTRWHVSAAGTTATARAVIIAAPARVAAELIQPSIPRRIRSGRVPYVSTVSIG